MRTGVLVVRVFAFLTAVAREEDCALRRVHTQQPVHMPRSASEPRQKLALPIIPVQMPPAVSLRPPGPTIIRRQSDSEGPQRDLKATSNGIKIFGMTRNASKDLPDDIVTDQAELVEHVVTSVDVGVGALGDDGADGAAGGVLRESGRVSRLRSVTVLVLSRDR